MGGLRYHLVAKPASPAAGGRMVGPSAGPDGVSLAPDVRAMRGPSWRPGRKLVVTKHFGGRDHPYAYENPEGLRAPELPATVMVSTRNGSNGNGSNGNGHSNGR